MHAMFPWEGAQFEQHQVPAVCYWECWCRWTMLAMCQWNRTKRRPNVLHSLFRWPCGSVRVMSSVRGRRAGEQQQDRVRAVQKGTSRCGWGVQPVS